MGRRILGIAVLSTVIAVVLFGAPLGYAVWQLVVGNEHDELQRVALQAAIGVPPDYATSGDPVELPVVAGVEVGLYTPDGRRFAGSGPLAADPTVDAATAGGSSSPDSDAELVVAVPVSAHERVTGVVRTASPRSSVTSRILQGWAALALLAAVAAAAALLLARRLTRRLVQPVQALERAAEELGSGNFGIRAAESDIAEVDGLARALNRTAQRLGELVSRERNFATHASHQLRTPLTGLRLRLESSLAAPEGKLRQAVAAGLADIDALSRTVDDVLLAARPERYSAVALDLSALFREVDLRWRGRLAEASRPLRIRDEAQGLAAASLPAVRQILEVLLDNAYRHGRGAVTVTARDVVGGLVLEVDDEGADPSSSAPPGHGLGLALAHQLASAHGGRVVRSRNGPGTRFSLYLPEAVVPTGDADARSP